MRRSLSQNNSAALGDPMGAPFDAASPDGLIFLIPTSDFVLRRASPGVTRSSPNGWARVYSGPLAGASTSLARRAPLSGTDMQGLAPERQLILPRRSHR